MKTKNEVTEQFIAELKALLAKYDTESDIATIEAEDERSGARITVIIPPIYDADYNVIRERVSIDLGRWITS